MKSRANRTIKIYRSPIAISFAIHLVLIILLIWGGDFSIEPPKPNHKTVSVTVIDPKVIQQQAQNLRQQRETEIQAEKNRQEAEKKALLQKQQQQKEEQQRKAEAEKIRRQQQEQQQQEQQQKEQAAKEAAEKKAAAKAEQERIIKEKAIKEADAKKAAAKMAAEKAEQERVAKEKAEKQAAEKQAAEKKAAAEQERIAKEKAAKQAAEKQAAEKKAAAEKAAREQREQEAALNDIFGELESESKQNSAARGQFVISEAERYGETYKQMIQQQLLVEDSFKGKSCRVNLRLISTATGMITSSYSILEGDKKVCDASIRAIKRVNSFPLAKDKDVVEKLKNINLKIEL